MVHTVTYWQLRERRRITMSWVVFGTGRAARAVASRAAAEGCEIVVAGRNWDEGARISSDLGVPFLLAVLVDGELVVDLPSGVQGIFNAAGPFSVTANPVVSLCLKRGLNYADLSNEYASHRSVWARGQEATARGVVLVPGAGFGTLAVEHLVSCIARVTSDPVRIGIYLPWRRSQRAGNGVRASSQYVLAEAPRVWDGSGESRVLGVGVHRGVLCPGNSAVPVSNGDLVALARTFPNSRIEVFATSATSLWVMRLTLPLLRAMARHRVRVSSTLEGVHAVPEGQRRSEPGDDSSSGLWAIVTDRRGIASCWEMTVRGRLRFTAAAAVDVMRAIGRGVESGVCTPSRLLRGEGGYAREILSLGRVLPAAS